MTTPAPTSSYKNDRVQNALENRYVTIVLSEKRVEQAINIRCIGCGFAVFNTINIPRSIIDGMLLSEDVEKATDYKCSHCKITYRVT